jgi:pilus assembly protein CpaB
VNGRRIFLLSLLLALIATVIFSLYVRPTQQTAGGSLEMVEMVVAKNDIKQDTTITTDMLVTKSFPKSSLPNGVELEADQVVGKIAMERIVAGEPIASSRLVDANSDSAALVYKIPEGKRAISVAYNEVMGVAGFVSPGDYVDVISVLTLKPKGEDEEIDAARILLQNMLVLAVGGMKTEGTKSDTVDNAPLNTITLAAAPQEAEILTFSEEKGKIRLILRGAKDNDPVNTPGVDENNMLIKMTR